jgi:DNA-binding YbaB/EbfC family protein
MDMRHLLEQAKALERALKETEERLRQHESEGSAGGGAVRVRINGTGEVTFLSIAPELVAGRDAGLVEQTVLAALRQAAASARAYREKERAALTGGLKLPDY